MALEVSEYRDEEMREDFDCDAHSLAGGDDAEHWRELPVPQTGEVWRDVALGAAYRVVDTVEDEYNRRVKLRCVHAPEIWVEESELSALARLVKETSGRSFE
jgi:hypothetical protein